MPEEFDPYLHWLGIRDPQRPPNHYRLLGVELFEADPDVISNAADRQMAHVRTFQSGRRSAESQKILNELAGAKVCLLNPQKKAAYDAELQAERTGLDYPPPMPCLSEAAASRAPSHLPSPAARRFSVLWVAVPTLVAAGILVALLVVVFRGGRPFDGKGQIVRMDRDVEDHAGKPSEPPGAAEPALAAQGEPLAAAVKPDEPAKPDPGKQIDPQHAPNTAVEPLKKTEPPTTAGSESAMSEAKPPKAASEQLPPAPDSMAAARTAMKQRNVADARRHLDLAEKAALPRDREQLDRLNDLFTPWEAFWTAVRLGIPECKQGEVLRGQGMSAEVVRTADGVIFLRVGGRERRFRLRDLPAPLALAIADKKLPENAAALAKAAFLIVDPQGDPRQARALCEQSAQGGMAPSSGLAAELNEALAAVTPSPGPGAALAKPPARIPVPDAASQQSERKKVRDAFRARFAQARMPAEKSVLAADLFREAKESKDAPAARYALFAEARDLAIAAGEPARFRDVVLEMARNYEIDPLEEQTRALAEAAESPLPSPVRTALAKVAIGLAQDAIQSDRYDAAARLAEAGSTFAKKVSKGRDPQIIRQASELGETIPWYRQQHDLAAQAEKVVAQDPNNVKDAQFLGKYYALVKEQWDRGLPLLRKGEDATLKALAESEQAARWSATAADMVKLADQWLDAAPSLDGPYQHSARRRALYWYEAALPHATGLSKERAARAIETLKRLETPRRK